MKIWKDIPGFEGEFQASTLGQVKNIQTDLILNQTFSITRGNKRYLRCSINGYPYLAHRLIALTFIANPKNKSDVDHIDYNEQNNQVDNLRWVTPQENQKHSGPRMVKNKQGEKHPRALFTDEDVIAIRIMRKAKVKYKIIAERYGVKENTICSMITRRWKHLKG